MGIGTGTCCCTSSGCESSINCKTLTPCCLPLSGAVLTFTMSSADSCSAISSTNLTYSSGTNPVTMTGTSSGGHTITVVLELTTGTTYRVTSARVDYSGGTYIEWNCTDRGGGTFKYNILSDCTGNCTADFTIGGGTSTGCEGYPVDGFMKPFPATINLEMSGWRNRYEQEWGIYLGGGCYFYTSGSTDFCGNTHAFTGNVCEIPLHDIWQDQTVLNTTHSIPLLSSTATTATYRKVVGFYTSRQETYYLHRDFSGTCGYACGCWCPPPSGSTDLPGSILSSCDNTCSHVSGPHVEYTITIVITNSCGTSSITIERTKYTAACGGSPLNTEDTLVPLNSTMTNYFGSSPTSQNIIYGVSTYTFPVYFMTCYDVPPRDCDGGLPPTNNTYESDNIVCTVST